MKTNDYSRTNQTLRLSDILPLWKQNIQEQKANYRRSKSTKMTTKTSKWPSKILVETSEAAPQKPGPDSYGWVGALLFVVVFVIVMIPKSFWGALWQYIKQSNVENEPTTDKNTIEIGEDIKPTNKKDILGDL